jgi:chemotaxis signal transduction protein
MLLRIDGREYGLPLDCLVEVVRMAALAPVPGGPSFVLGLLDLRGRVVPVLDLRQRLGLPPAEPGLSTPICVVEAAGRGFGLVADAVSDIRPLVAPVEPLDLAAEDGPMAGVTHVEGRLVSLLAPDRLGRALEQLALPGPARSEAGR